MREIDFYFDLISPFAHVALARLSALPDDVTVRPRPVLLGPLLAHWGQRGPAEIAPKRLQTYRFSCFLGEKHGLSMKFPPRHPFNTLAPMRLLAGAGADMAMARRAFDFVFAEGRAPDTPEEFAAFADWIGVDAALASAQPAKDALRANTDEAISRGVFGVPTFAAQQHDGVELFWGVDAFDMLLAWLADETMFSRPPYAGLDNVEIGVTRKQAGG